MNCNPYQSQEPSSTNREMFQLSHAYFRNQNFFQCPLCYEIFYHKFQYYNHKATYCRGIHFIQNANNFALVNVKREQDQSTNPPQHEQYKCPICSFTMSNQDAFDTHMIEHHQQKSNSPPAFDHNCPKPFKIDQEQSPNEPSPSPHMDSPLVQLHVKHDGTELLMDNGPALAAKQLEAKSDMQPPQQQMMGGKEMQLPSPEPVPGSEYPLVQLHINSHSEYTCDQCDKSFKLKQQLQTHMMGVHSDSKPYICMTCGKSFKLKQTLLNHEKIHTNFKEYQCSFCPKSFTLKQQLNNHLKCHSDEKLFKCDDCDKSFKFKQQLQNHSYIHSGFKPFVCEVCSKLFTFKQQLQVHSKIHLNVKEFQCQVCAKCFRTKQQLQIHLKVHFNNNHHHNSHQQQHHHQQQHTNGIAAGPNLNNSQNVVNAINNVVNSNGSSNNSNNNSPLNNDNNSPYCNQA